MPFYKRPVKHHMSFCNTQNCCVFLAALHAIGLSIRRVTVKQAEEPKVKQEDAPVIELAPEKCVNVKHELREHVQKDFLSDFFIGQH